MADPPPGPLSEDLAIGQQTTSTPDSTLHVGLPTPSARQTAGPPLLRLGPYELIEKLGEGGMGAVWKARHTRLDKLVALKLLPRQLTSHSDAVQRFEREMRAVGKLEHPHIVRAMDAGEVDGVHYLVMELVEGRDLARVVKDRGPLPLAEACRHVRQAALGVAHAHAHGMIHRDIKPSNLLLSPADGVKVLDLGLARLHDDNAGEATLTSTGVVVGTPDFMAPEQWDNSHAVGPAADLYSLGCTLYFLLTGRPPFGDGRHTTHAQKMKAHLLLPPPDVNELRPDVPAELAALLDQLLKKDPLQRMANAGELAERLDSLETVLPGPPVASSAASNTAKSAGMSRAILAGGAAILAIGAISLALWAGGLLNRGQPPAPVPSPSPVPSGAAPAGAVAPFTADEATLAQQRWASHVGLDVEYKNSLGMRFRLLPPGKFQMGSDAAEIAGVIAQAEQLDLPGFFREKFPLEQPRHWVAFSRPLYVGATEVTQEQYQAVMGTNPAYYSPEGGGKAAVPGQDSSQYPVESVSWHDALAFVARLNERENRSTPASIDLAHASYRLPTEAEWEYACRSGSESRYAAGDDVHSLAAAAWFADNSGGTTKRVATRQPNAFGLCDMHGNVWEWCLDGWEGGAYPAVDGPRQDPYVAAAPEANRVARGGSWQHTAIISRSANRGALPPGERASGVGFRVVLPIAPLTKP